MLDIKNLGRFGQSGGHWPTLSRGPLAFDGPALGGGAIPLKYAELMALALALANQSPSCVQVHFQKAKNAGATEQELAEAPLIAAAAGACVASKRDTPTRD